MRPFALAFGELPLAGFCALPHREVFERTLGTHPGPGRERSHLSPEGRVRSICEVCAVLLRDGVTASEAARRMLADRQIRPPLERRLLSCSGIGEVLLSDLRMNLGVLTVEVGGNVRRFLDNYLDVPSPGVACDYTARLEALQDELGMTPFEVDRIVRYAQSPGGRV